MKGDAMRVAVFGGSFDPPHMAHVLMTTWARVGAGMDHVLWVPTYVHAFGKALSPFDARRALCDLALADLPFASVSTIEEELGGTSRTLHTLEALRDRHPEWTLRLLMGSDLLADAHRWHRWDAVVAIAPPLIARRPGEGADVAAESPLMPDLSSTGIRARLRAGQPVDGLVPRNVADAIARRGMYVADPEGA